MRVLYLIIFMLLPGFLSAQQKHFLYIQGENQQAFYVKMEGVIFSSSASGFIILPRLDNGAVDMVIGFPRALWPESSFRVEIKSADKGLILKNTTDKGWILQDLQSQQMIEGIQAVAKKQESGAAKKTTDDPFASTLADAISDPGIREVDLISTTSTVPKKTVSPAAPVVTANPVQQTIKETASATPVKPAVVEEKPIAVVVKQEEKPFVNEVKKLNETRSQTSVGLVYLDINGELSDTVFISIDASQIVEAAAVIFSADSSEKDSPPIKVSEPVAVKENPIVPEASVSKQSSTPTTEKASAITEVDYEKTAAVVLPERKDCKQTATEKDMLSARKKAYSLGVDAEVIRHYTKEVKSRCYTTGLLQSLSFAFVNDASRFEFFKEAYPWVMDPANFPQLERLFVSKDFISKFRKLINAE